MKVEDFLNKYKMAKDKEEFFKKHITTTYVPYLTKCVYCSNIVSASHHLPDEKDIIKINTANQYVAFVTRLLDLYTDLDIDFNNGGFLKQYDQLNQNGCIIPLIAAIPEQEYAEFKMVLDMKESDFRENEYSLTAILYNLKKSIDISGDVIEQALNQLVKESEKSK